MTVRIRAITFDGPDAQGLASFYAEVMAMPTRFVDTAERVEIGHDHGRTRLAFVTVPDHRRPTWPDPRYPQQLHLDLPAFDDDRVRGRDDTEPAWFSPLWHERVIDLGATRLPHRGGGCPVYADPAGHPFCLCAAPRARTDAPVEPHAVIDCFVSAPALATFYAELLQLHDRVEDSPGWVIIRSGDGRPPGLSFAAAAGNAPRWQDPERPRQAYLELEADDHRAAEQLALSLGATRLTPRSSDRILFADPEGHPFSLAASGRP
ncbi:VOC family protein [Microlunatus sp. GCM10028923]|uniref:VOC family protein n=1 Tax=Microlunatus sp. GCM10028923 TaxID=3273400 RepID=UPI00360A7BCB